MSTAVAAKPKPRLQEKYETLVVPEMMKKFALTHRLAAPRILKIVVNAGVGKAIENKKRMDDAVRDISIVTGQKPLITRAKTAVSGFKLRKGMPIGCKVTLRGKRMYEFMDRLISLAIPRIKDFRGLPRNSFDGQGNYTMGLEEQTVFPEINADTLEFTQGMDITFVISGGKKEQAFELLRLMGMPFRAQ
ncbi:MAG: 50S ribosomal protein L5 [Planctomycetes bacterium]|nr:50S ribosomal protein L5 [Planctomycetota bacterium]MBM4078475.1 50S ribosomal protein L5 [Planctomycetota bacterium]MBM4083181.1 50S ribosomal protein L5 [Planctomycetota bacterium]